jgi:hypothetical protein
LSRTEGRRSRWAPAHGWQPEEHRIMTIIRTVAGLTRHDVRRIKRGRYEILAIETRHLDQDDVTDIIWHRDEKPDAITAAEIPF